MRLALFLLLLLLGALAAWLLVQNSGIADWAVAQQRRYQNDMAGAVRALRGGEAGAVFSLIWGAALYGVVHAVGPGHGKYLIGGVALGSSIDRSRLAGIAVAASVVQALWAVLLVYGGFAVLGLAMSRMSVVAETVLAPLSYAAIGAVGIVLAWRGLGRFRERPGAADEAECGCPAHGPSPQAVAAANSPAAVLSLILGIAVRPCTGAVFLLVIAWQMGFPVAGAAAVIAMGLGTALVTVSVAFGGVASRGLVGSAGRTLGAARAVAPALQLLAGGAIAWISFVLLAATV